MGAKTFCVLYQSDKRNGEMRKQSLLLLAALMLLMAGCKQSGNSPQITDTN